MNTKHMKIPERIAVLPRDPRGYPITFVTMIDAKGKAHFTTTDAVKRVKALAERLCAICGQELDKEMAFIGGEQCMSHHHFYDPPMHLECAEYSFEVCPFLSMDSYKNLASKPADTPGMTTRINESISSVRPARMGILVCCDYKLVEHDNNVYVKAVDVKSVIWK